MPVVWHLDWARSSVGQNAPLITVLSQVRVLPGPPPSPPLFRRAWETARKGPFVAVFGASSLAETPDSRRFPRLFEKSLWRPISAPTPSCCRGFESFSRHQNRNAATIIVVSGGVSIVGVPEIDEREH